MSNITRRQREIVEFLLEHPHEVTAGEIAVAVKVSTRTVHRELQMIEQWLEPLGMRLEKNREPGFELIPVPMIWLYCANNLSLTNM
ncbi:HTH domain-containing protein [Paenibacillus sp. 1A_MP2]|uniref:HTH domain-containing protein n=1 Tax=Paenibacillus sp. 1A_MP2 TaxID=3457495 RepID=UPI003FCDEA19